MTIAMPNSAFALNDVAWANLYPDFLLDGFRFYTGIPGTGSYRPLPVIATGLANVTPSFDTASSEAPPADALFAKQWHFAWLGDIQKIWEDYTGEGVHVGVYDDGLETTHPDLAANYDPSLQVWVWGEEMTPDPWQGPIYLQGGQHGTAVSGLIAGARNDVGVVGVAYGASLTGVDILSGHDLSDINQNFWGFWEAAWNSTNFDVVNHSWGNSSYFYQSEHFSDQVMYDQATIDAWMNALQYGRDGLGTIQVKAAGNEGLNANGVSAQSTRATIIVGAYNDQGEVSYYSNHGSNLLVSAPSNGRANNAGLVTTDLTGSHTEGGYTYNYGYNGLPDLDYTNRFGGTSGATPIVTGVVSLMLQANANLGWRDVQNILAYSAREVGSGVGNAPKGYEYFNWGYNGADNWNGGGLHFSNDYGFGSVDAYNAVRMAEAWSLFGTPKTSENETSYSHNLTEQVAIGDMSTTDIKFTFSGDPMTVDFVNVELTISHPILYELEVYLISPNGTVTELIDFGKQNYDIVSSGWTANFGANAFRGEEGIGDWTIRIVDQWQFDAGTLDAAKITLHGTDGGQAANDLTSDVYHYTSEVFTSLARDSSRMTLTDSDGGSDWINAAAMASNLVVRLGKGETSTAGGVAFVAIGADTDIENAVTGDGNDEIYGNALDNKLYGMRGNDLLIGGAGNDTLSGGAGNDTLTGGIGADNFLFDRALGAANVDVITDFSHIDDTIWLDMAVFAGLTLGQLDASLFYVYGTGTFGEEDRILFDLGTGSLYFDADGSGTGSAAILFATFEIGSIPLDLSFDDFLVVSSAPGAAGHADDRPDGYDPVTVTTTPLPPANLGGLIVGSETNDTIITKDLDDRVFGKDGDDYISTGKGNDFVDGGAGQDEIYGGDGDDWLVGGGSSQNEGGGPLLSPPGDVIDGGMGNDFIQGSNQQNDWTYFQSGVQDDYLFGGLGDDIIFGLDGDDYIDGDRWFDPVTGGDEKTGGNDIIYGGAGSDYLFGGFGDDRIYAGTGRQNWIHGDRPGGLPPGAVNGVDTAVFENSYGDYIITGWSLNPEELLITRITPGARESTIINIGSFEYLEFADQTIDLRARSMVYNQDNFTNNSQAQSFADIALDPDGYEIQAYLRGANNVTINDSGAENGGIDKFHTALLSNITGDVVINSDAFGYLNIVDLYGADNVWGRPEFNGSVTINAAEGERTLQLRFGSLTLDAGERLTDDTATEVIFTTLGYLDYATHANGAAANDYNLSFAAAEKLTFKLNDGDIHLKWFIPKVSLIDMQVYWPDIVGFDDDLNGGNQRTITIETALDDELFATGGGSESYKFIGWGTEHIRLGNLGLVNASNDGTNDGMEIANRGLGLRGFLDLNGGGDEVRILGTDAFQGGTIRAGASDADGSDVLRMTFAVAAGIQDISGYIEGFEYVQFDVTSQSHTVDTDKFDDLRQVIIRGYSGVAGENTVNLTDGAKVIIKSVGSDDHFGNLHLTGSGNELTLSFVDLWTETEQLVVTDVLPQASTEATGIIHIRDATAVHIVTNSRDDLTHGQYGGYEAIAPLDSFGQALDLDSATTLTIIGDTGWDFTVAGTDIGQVLSLDASGVTSTGALGGVTAFAQSSAAVTFTGGNGDDTFKGNAGHDTLSGGQGFDTAIFSGASSDYTFSTVDGKLVVTDNRGIDGSDTLIDIERMVFTDGTFGASETLSGKPYDLSISAASVAENSENGTVVGLLSTRDPDSNDDFTYSIVSDPANAFAIDGNKLVVGNFLNVDYEIRGTMYVTIRSTDSAGQFVDNQIAISVLNVDPDNVIGNDDANSIGGGSGDDVIDGRGGDDFLLTGMGNDTITGGAGDDFIDGYAGVDTVIFSGNRSDYRIEGYSWDALKIQDLRSGSPDGTDSVYSIEFLRFADGDVSTRDLLANSAPTDILPDTASIAENSADGTVVAELSATDPDSGETFTFVLMDDAGGRFEIIDGNKLVVKDSTGLDYEAATEHTVTIKVTDSAGHILEQQITVEVTDVEENAPASVALTGVLVSIAENASTATRTKVADIVVTDDGNGTNTLGLTGRNAALFEIVGMALYLKAGVALDAALAADLQVAVTVDDDGIAGSPDATSATFHLAVQDIAGLTMVNGTSASQTLTGTSGNDWFDGKGGSDTFKGGKGNDTYIVDSSGDKVIEASGQGTDKVLASVSHTLASNVENLTLTGDAAINGTGNSSNNILIGNAANNRLSGGAGNDSLYGGDGNDTLDGGTGNDRLYGEAGNDLLRGGAGNDRLDGGLGRDYLYGGVGRDVFDFNSIADSAVGATRDIVQDFQRTFDRIDLSTIDANVNADGNQAFSWIGTAGFTGKAGQLHIIDQGSQVIVQGDVNGDRHADFEILVKVGTLGSGDFIL